MQIVTNIIYHLGGSPGNLLIEPGYGDIFKAHSRVSRHLLKEKYFILDLVNKTRPIVSSETFFDPKRIIYVENRARYPYEKNNSALELMIAAKPEELEGIVFVLRDASGLPIGSWKELPPMEHNLPDDFNLSNYRNFSELKKGIGEVFSDNNKDTAIISSKRVVSKR